MHCLTIIKTDSLRTAEGTVGGYICSLCGKMFFQSTTSVNPIFKEQIIGRDKTKLTINIFMLFYSSRLSAELYTVLYIPFRELEIFKLLVYVFVSWV
jgi:hypothetical protein